MRVVRRKVIARFNECMKISARGKRLGYELERLEQIDKDEFMIPYDNVGYFDIPFSILSKLGYNFLKSFDSISYTNMKRDNDIWVMVLSYSY